MKKFIILLLVFFACKMQEDVVVPTNEESVCDRRTVNYQEIAGCDGQIYPHPDSSKYILPFAAGIGYQMGLTNCSSSYHAAGNPDEYAFDFNMAEGDEFIASRAGVVHHVVESESSRGGGVGNYVIIDHGDDTYGMYLHSPKNGIHVEVGDEVKQGDVLGVSGNSGLAGYPHLHLIIVKGSPQWPYKGMPISFKNAVPGDVVLKSYSTYLACDN